MYEVIKCACGKNLGKLNQLYQIGANEAKTAYYKKHKLDENYPSNRVDFTTEQVLKDLNLTRECCINKIISNKTIRTYM